MEFDRCFPRLKPVFQAGFRSFMGAPLISRDQVIGTLQFRSKKPKVYEQRELKLAERIAHQIAGAIANAQFFLKLKGTEKALRVSEKQLCLLSSHLLMAQETERRRISRELHDELGQALTLPKRCIKKFRGIPLTLPSPLRGGGLGWGGEIHRR